MEHIRNTDQKANIIYINMELDNYIHIKTHTDLSAYLEGKFIEDKSNYFLIDEVREVQEFESSFVLLIWMKALPIENSVIC